MKTKNLIYFFWLALIFFGLSMDPAFTLQAQEFRAPGNPGPNIQSLTGDMPLTTLETFAGNVDVEVKVVAHAGSGSAGTFTLSTIPAGATILRAYVITTSFSGSAIETATAVFAGTGLGTKPPDNTDEGGSLFCREYRFDVTALVSGNASYDYSISGINSNYGDALVVVYQHSSLPVRRIVINDGSESLQGSTSTTSLAGFAAGAARMILFTQADDTFSGGGESVAVNGTVVLGPGDVFNSNQGPYASLIDMPVATVAGANSIDVTTGSDWFGLHLAILSGLPGTPPPTLTSIRPSSAARGKTVYARLDGTNFAIGTTTVQVGGTGVTVGPVNPDGGGTSTRVTAKFVIEPSAPIGQRDVTVTTAGGRSNPVIFTVAPDAQCPTASLPLTVAGNRGNLNITAGMGTSRQITGTWVVGWMVFNPKTFSFSGRSLFSGTLAPTNPPTLRSFSASLAPVSAVAVVNAFYNPYLCAYTVTWASTTGSERPTEPLARSQVEAALNNLALEDVNGTTQEIPR